MTLRGIVARACLVVPCVVACDSPTAPAEPTESRALGLVAAGEHPIYPRRETPRIRVIEDRWVEVEITTLGSCQVNRPDWYVLQTGDLLFILPYEYRSNQCDLPPGPQQVMVPFTDTIEYELGGGREITVRVVSGDGSVLDMDLEFAPTFFPGDCCRPSHTTLSSPDRGRYQGSEPDAAAGRQ